jgi:hypothetical protein
MKHEEGGTRVDTLRDTLKTVSAVYSLAAKGKGITALRFLNGGEHYPNVAPGAIGTLMERVVFEGLTPIGTRLRDKVLANHVKKDMKKPLLVIIITDGEVSHCTLLVRQ